MVEVDLNRYVFTAEWNDTSTFTLRHFLLFYFPVDSTVELYDIKGERTYLKRTKCEEIKSDDLFITAKIRILSRQLTITDYGNIFTKKKFTSLRQRTMALVKYEGMDNMAQIIQRIYKEGMKITRLKMVRFTEAFVEAFYEDLIGTIDMAFLIINTAGPLLGMEIMSDNAISKWRQLIGPADPADARRDCPNSLRALYGKDITHNAVHGSDSVKTVQREISLFFPSTLQPKHFAPAPTVTLYCSTCCIVKPHAIREALLGDVIVAIQEEGFKVTAMEMFYLDTICGEEFLEVYKTVLPDYSEMVRELTSGPCVAMEISGCGAKTVQKFREFAGPPDPMQKLIKFE